MEITRLDFYAALDLAPSATAEQIASAYRFAMESYGPGALASYGLIDDAEREEIMRFLAEAHRVLSDANLRRDYNRKLLAEAKYSPEELRFEAAAPPGPPVAAPRNTASPAAPVFGAGEDDTTIPHLTNHGVKDRSIWPFADKQEKPKAEPARPAAPAHPATPAPAAPPVQIPALDGRPFGGAELKQIREARGLRLDEVSSQTKISLSNLRFIEESNFAFLPAPVYLKGFLRTYAKVLRIDGDRLVREYMAAYEAGRPAAE